MTFRRDRFATRTYPQPPLLKTGDIFDYNGQRYRVTSHSRWYCGAVRSYPPLPNLGRIVADGFAEMVEHELKVIQEINREYSEKFSSCS